MVKAVYNVRNVAKMHHDSHEINLTKIINDHDARGRVDSPTARTKTTGSLF